MEKVPLSKARLSRGCNPDIKKHYWPEEKMEGRCDLIQVRIYENEFGAMKHAAANAYRTDDHERGEKPRGGAIALLKPKKRQSQ